MSRSPFLFPATGLEDLPVLSQDLDNGSYAVELIHEWVTASAPHQGLTNVSVLLDQRHIPGSPFLFASAHQVAVSPRPGRRAPLPPRPTLVPASDTRRGRHRAAAADAEPAVEPVAAGRRRVRHPRRDRGVRPRRAGPPERAPRCAPCRAAPALVSRPPSLPPASRRGAALHPTLRPHGRIRVVE